MNKSFLDNCEANPEAQFKKSVVGGKNAHTWSFILYKYSPFFGSFASEVIRL